MTTQELVERLRGLQTTCPTLHETFDAAASRLSKIEDALKSCEAWLTSWGLHIGNCRGERREDACTCGLVAIRHEARAALEHQQKGEP